MSTEPNPWSRPAAGQQGWSNPSEPTRTVGSDAGHRASRPSDDQPTGTYGGPRASGTITMQSAASTATPSAGPAVARVRNRIAGVVALVTLAAGVGGGAGVAIDRYLIGDAAGSNGVQTQVVQADASNPNWAAVAEAATKAVVAITVSAPDGSQAQGSGVVIDAAGHVVTNNHVISGVGGTAELTVTLDNVAYSASVVGTDPATDLAVIKLIDPPAELQVLPFADQSGLQVGDPVMAIGNPLGLADTVTTGIVSALDRPVTTQASGTSPISSRTDSVVVTAAIQTTAAINPGNSGGALVNKSGQLVGITSSIASLSSDSSESGNIGIGFAIGSDQVRYVVDQLISTGTAQHARIGVSAGDVTGTGQQGAVISSVTDGSPAAQAGLQPGDVVTAVNGRTVTSTESLVALIRAQRVGVEVTLDLRRDGQPQQVKITPVAADR